MSSSYPLWRFEELSPAYGADPASFKLVSPPRGCSLELPGPLPDPDLLDSPSKGSFLLESGED